MYKRSHKKRHPDRQHVRESAKAERGKDRKKQHIDPYKHIKKAKNKISDTDTETWFCDIARELGKGRSVYKALRYATDKTYGRLRDRAERLIYDIDEDPVSKAPFINFYKDDFDTGTKECIELIYAMYAKGEPDAHTGSKKLLAMRERYIKRSALKTASKRKKARAVGAVLALALSIIAGALICDISYKQIAAKNTQNYIQRKQDMRNALSSAMTMTVSEVKARDDLRISNSNEMMAAFLQSLLEKVDPEMDLTVKIGRMDHDTGTMEVEATGEYGINGESTKESVTVKRKVVFTDELHHLR